MPLIALLITLVIVGLLAATQLKSKPESKPVDIGGVQVQVPQNAKDLKKFEQDINKAVSATANDQRKKEDEANPWKLQHGMSIP